MKVTKYIMIFSLIAGYSLAQAQQRPIYKAKPLSPEDISRKQHIPEWQPPTTRDRKSTRLNSSHSRKSRMPSSA